MDFSSLQKKVFTGYFEGRYEEALEAALVALERYPEFFYQTGFWAACLYCRTGNPDKAMIALQEALEKGAWWSEETLQDEDLKPLWERAEFERLKAVCRERQAETPKVSQPDLLVLEPGDRGSGESFPLLLALHGRGGEIRSFSARWDLPAIRDSYILAFPQSSQVCGLKQHCWDDRELAGREIGRVRDQLAGRHDVDGRAIVVAGFSQGGTLAVELALGQMDCAGFIAIVPGVNDAERLITPLRESVGRRKGCIITGDRDYGYTRTVEFAEALQKNGFPCKLLTVAGMAHDIPEDFASLLRQAVDFVTSR